MKSEEYTYLVYEVRQLQKQYFGQGRDKEALQKALIKETELDRWNSRTRAYITAHPGMQAVKAQQPEFAFFQIVEKWRKHWKDYFAYKKRSGANPDIAREMAKKCRDYENTIDSYIRQALHL